MLRNNSQGVADQTTDKSSHRRNENLGIFVPNVNQASSQSEVHIVNLVDSLKDQLMGEAGKKLGSMIGAKDSDIGKILGAGLPSVFSGLGAVASTKGGADKLSKTIGGMDSSAFGDLGKMLDSSAMSGGGRMLGGLLGEGVVDGIANKVAKFVGVNVTIVKAALGYLAPVVLGSVAASLKGAKPDGTGLAKLFSDQKSNIAAAMPAGLSLDSVPGFNSLANNIASTTNQAVADAGGGPGKLLVPGAVIAALIAAGIFFFNNGKKEPEAIKENAADSNKAAIGAMQETSSMVDQVTEARTEAVKTSINGMMDGLMTHLGGIQDSASAEAALPTLTDMASKVDGLGLSISALPDSQRTIMGGIIKAQLEKITPLMEKISALPGIGDPIKTLLNQLRDKLAGFIS